MYLVTSSCNIFTSATKNITPKYRLQLSNAYLSSCLFKGRCKSTHQKVPFLDKNLNPKYWGCKYISSIESCYIIISYKNIIENSLKKIENYTIGFEHGIFYMLFICCCSPSPSQFIFSRKTKVYFTHKSKPVNL